MTKKIKFTQPSIERYKCEPRKQQSFIWDTVAKGLGLRATVNGNKAYVFQSKLGGQTIRITIGDVKTWYLSVPESKKGTGVANGAREEATRLSRLIDEGKDPRREKAKAIANDKAEKKAEIESREAEHAKELREAVTLAVAWEAYTEDRCGAWSTHHIRDHVRIIQRGGDKRSRGTKLKEPGVLASLADIRLVDVTEELIEEWAKIESKKRPTQARLGLRLLKAFLKWCTRHKTYKHIVVNGVPESEQARRILGKPQAKNDVLQKEQLPSWFSAIKQIDNPVISAYLQSLLILGSRREELAKLKWEDVDFQWNTIQFSGKKTDGDRIIPMTPYVAHLLNSLPRRNEWVFSSPVSATKRLVEPSIAHRKACKIAGLNVSLHGLRRSFASLCEWIEMPAGIAAQIQGHAPQGVREQNYIRRPLDLLRKWHVKIEGWILEEAGIAFEPSPNKLRVLSKK